MGTNNLDGRPSPVSPLWYCLDAQLDLACACGRRETVRPGIIFRGQDPQARLHELAARLRCTACGARPRAKEVR